jgi:hypothetical protein
MFHPSNHEPAIFDLAQDLQLALNLVQGRERVGSVGCMAGHSVDYDHFNGFSQLGRYLSRSFLLVNLLRR